MKPSYLLSLIFLFVTKQFCASPNAEKCCECVCTEDKGNIVANCIRRSLTTIPNCVDIKTSTNIFLLSYNLISNITEDSFSRYLNLSILQLSKNKINYIHERAFVNLTNLRVLNIRDNRLSYTRTIFKPHIFESLTRVTRLQMDDNNYNDNGTYPDYALGKLSALQELQIDGLQNKPFGEGFLNLTNLVKIRITSRQCCMSVITNETFKFLPHLKGIYIINCSLHYIEPGSFKHQVNIKRLSLSDNQKLGFDGVTNATSNISYTLETLYIKRIVAWDSICVVVHKSFAQNLQNTSLKILSADDNRIEAFDSGALQLLPKSLKTVTMKGHNFQFSNYVFDLYCLTGLTVIDLTGKDKRNFHYFQEKFLSVLEPDKRDIFYSNNVIWPRFESKKLSLPPILKKVTFTSAQLYYEIGNIVVAANKLETINISRNLLTRWIGPIHGLEGLTYLDLSYNFANTVSKNFFQYFPNLTLLNVSHNLLGREIKNMTSGNVFQNLTKLRNLDLTDNYIFKLPQFLFSSLTSLEILDVSKNRIHSLNIEISTLKRLKSIICQNNNIQWLAWYARSQIDQLAERGNISLDLSGNPIACTCNNLYFLKWMIDSRASGKIEFGNLSNYQCFYSNGRQVTLEKLENVYNNVMMLCVNYVGFCLGMTCVFLVSLSMIICGLLYRFRWKLRYLYYAARHKVHTEVSSEQNGHDFTYDAFVSFAEEDRDFVVNELLDKLEVESNLCLNFHQRNFTPGRPIAENIIEAVKTSKRTLILLSRNFLESYWCIYELQMANMESVTTGRDVLLIVMMEDIPTRKIPTQILYHIQTDSYIQYPSEGDTDMFWRNMTDILKR